MNETYPCVIPSEPLNFARDLRLRERGIPKMMHLIRNIIGILRT